MAIKPDITIGKQMPKVGVPFSCTQLIIDKKNNSITFQLITTSNVQKVYKLFGNVYLILTENSHYYITKVPVDVNDDVYFALISSMPVVGKSMKCYRIRNYNEKTKFNFCITTPVKDVTSVKGMYRIRTRNSTYLCFPTM